MFSVTPSEVLVIVVIALIIFGPGRLAEVSRRAGQIAGQLRRQAEELKAGLSEELGELQELKELGGLKDVTSSIGSDVKEIAKPFREAGTELAAAGKELTETTEGELKWVDGPREETDEETGDDDGRREPEDAGDPAEPGDG